MKSLLTQLSFETFVFDLTHELTTLPTFKNIVHAQLADDKTLEITLNKEQSLNHIFAQFNELGIDIISMRNKNNRLEELFMGVVDSHFHDGKMNHTNPTNHDK